MMARPVALCDSETQVAPDIAAVRRSRAAGPGRRTRPAPARQSEDAVPAGTPGPERASQIGFGRSRHVHEVAGPRPLRLHPAEGRSGPNPPATGIVPRTARAAHSNRPMTIWSPEMLRCNKNASQGAGRLSRRPTTDAWTAPAHAAVRPGAAPRGGRNR